MPRPIKPRKIGYIPQHKLFVPYDKKRLSNDTILLLHDELEALRLKDIEHLNQNEAAEVMGVSRQTFQLILDSAHQKVATALVEGQAIKIEGGNYTLSERAHRCPQCGKIHQTNAIIEGNCNRKRRRCRNCRNE